MAIRKGLKVRTKRERRREDFSQHKLEEMMQTAEEESAGAWSQIRPLLDEEMARLPEKIRWPLLLCY